MSFLEEINQGPVLADAALDGEAAERALYEPGDAAGHHQACLAAGARLLRVAARDASRVALAGRAGGLMAGEIHWMAAQTAKQAAKDFKARVAACVGPLPAGLPRERWMEQFLDQIGGQLDGGAGLVVLDGFSRLEEVLVALEAKLTLHHCPVIALLAPGPDGRLAGGVELPEAFAAMRAAEADVVGVTGADAETCLGWLRQGNDAGPLAVFPHGPTAAHAAALVAAGARVLGLGPGWLPELAALGKALGEKDEA